MFCFTYIHEPFSFFTILYVEEEERKLYFNNLLHIHQHTFFKYMIQLVIEGKKSGDKYVCIRYSPIKQN